MADVLKLYWTDKYLGDIRHPRPFDYPWLIGDFTATNIDNQLAEVLDWFANLANADDDEEDDDLPDPPFPEEFSDNWYIQKPDGTRDPISVPIVDKKDDTIMWR